MSRVTALTTPRSAPGVALFRVSVIIPILLIAWAMGASVGTGGTCTRAFLFSAAACLLFTCSVTAGDIKLVNPVIKAFVPGSLAFYLTQISQVNIFFVASSRRYLFVFFQFSKVALFTPPANPTSILIIFMSIIFKCLAFVMLAIKRSETLSQRIVLVNM